jgi:hypothetical protein
MRMAANKKKKKPKQSPDVFLTRLTPTGPVSQHFLVVNFFYPI